MREQPRLAVSASSSACTSSRVRPTTSSRFSQSADARRPLTAPRAQRRAQLLQKSFVPDDEQRLRRLMQQVEDLAAVGARVDVSTIREQLHASAAAGRVEQTDAKTAAQDFENLMELVDGEAAAAQVSEHEQLEQLDGRVTAFRVAARVRLVRGDGGRDEPALVPQLQLARSQSGERGDLARTVRA